MMGTQLVFILLVCMMMSVESRTHLQPKKILKNLENSYYPSDLEKSDSSLESKNINSETGVHSIARDSQNLTDGTDTDNNSTDEDLLIHTASWLFPEEYQGLPNFSQIIQQSLQERKGGSEIPFRAQVFTAHCSDKFSSCQSSANEGRCNNNPFMMYWCTKACGICPATFLFMNDYNTAQFFTLRNEEEPWTYAWSRCQGLKTKLAVPQNPQLFHQILSQMVSGHDLRFWIAGWDYPNEGHWTWATTATPIGNFPWGPGQPDNWNRNEDCLEWGYGKNYNDENCNSKRHAVCEHAIWKR